MKLTRRDFLIKCALAGATLAGVSFSGCEQREASAVKQPSLSSSPSNEFNLEPFNECAEFLERMYKEKDLGLQLLFCYFIQPTNHPLINKRFYGLLRRREEIDTESIPRPLLQTPFEANLIHFLHNETPVEYFFAQLEDEKGYYFSDLDKDKKERMIRKLDERIEEALKNGNLRKEDIEDWGTHGLVIEDRTESPPEKYYTWRPFILSSDGKCYLLKEEVYEVIYLSEAFPKKIILDELPYLEIEDYISYWTKPENLRILDECCGDYLRKKGKKWVKLVKSHDETYPLRLKYRDVEPRKKIAEKEAEYL